MSDGAAYRRDKLQTRLADAAAATAFLADADVTVEEIDSVPEFYAPPPPPSPLPSRRRRHPRRRRRAEPACGADRHRRRRGGRRRARAGVHRQRDRLVREATATSRRAGAREGEEEVARRVRVGRWCQNVGCLVYKMIQKRVRQPADDGRRTRRAAPVKGWLELATEHAPQTSWISIICSQSTTNCGNAPIALEYFAGRDDPRGRAQYRARNGRGLASRRPGTGNSRRGAAASGARAAGGGGDRRGDRGARRVQVGLQRPARAAGAEPPSSAPARRRAGRCRRSAASCCSAGRTAASGCASAAWPRWR